MSSATTHTTEAGNLWVWTLGSQEDVWVRQRDRHRCFLAESDTAGVETVDVNSPVGPWFRLGEALGLKGQVALVSSGAMHILLHDGERVHLFAPEDDFLKLPTTVVPALLDDEVDAVDAILAVVEAKPAEHLPAGVSFWHRKSGGPYIEIESGAVVSTGLGLPAILEQEYRFRELGGEDGWSAVDPAKLMRWFKGRCEAPDEASAPVGIKREVAYNDEPPAAARVLDGSAPRVKAWAIAERKHRAHAARIKGIEAAIDRHVGWLGSQLGGVSPGERANLAASLEHLTAARLNIVKAGPS